MNRRNSKRLKLEKMARETKTLIEKTHNETLKEILEIKLEQIQKTLGTFPEYDRKEIFKGENYKYGGEIYEYYNLKPNGLGLT